MSPEPSFTQALREEGFIQDIDVHNTANETKKEVVDKVEETKNVVEETKVETEAKVSQANSFADNTAKSTSNESFIGKLIDSIKSIF